ncbi:hypothetical protein [Luoshenia tenuis]|uniref:hypothetical protein n=1 Tax=Luoshenia tenuis TaxID=2763654 RepID=UPI003D8E5C55
MKRRKLTVLALVLSLIFFFGTLGNLVIMNTSMPSEANTTELSATVTGIGIKGEGDHKYCAIYSQEYGDKLSTYELRGISDISDFTSLQRGQTIFFRVEKIWLKQIIERENWPFIHVIAIRTEEDEIVSLDDYNKQWIEGHVAPTIAGSVVVFIFLLLSIHCALLLKGINIFRRLKKRR